MSLIVIGILALTGVLGVLLLLRGRRGVAIDDHPLCRRCGFDLTGRPDAGGRCSECGADLAAAGAIRIGHRVPRRKLVLAGAAMILIGFGAAGAAMWAASADVNWQQYKPVWLLVRESGDPDAKVRDGALGELASRLSAGKLTDAQILALADHALALQADGTRPWATAWGDLVETAETMNKLPKERFEKYARQALNLKLEVRPEVRKGDRIPYWVRSLPARVGSRTLFVSRPVEHKRRSYLGTIDLGEAGVGGSGSISATGGSASGSSLGVSKFLDRLPPGKTTVKLTDTVQIKKSWDDNAPVLATRDVELTATFDLLPPERPTVKVVRDESIRAQVEAAIKCDHLTLQKGNPSRYLNFTVNVRPRPVGVGYQLFARVPGATEEFKLGTFAAPASKTGGFGSGASVTNFTATKIDLILRPDVDAAIGTTDTFEIWDGEIVIKDVPVK